MRKVNLNMKEQEKYNVIKHLVEAKGNKKKAATTLGCDIRTINRLIILYKTEGKAGFAHKNRGRPSPTKIAEAIKQEIINNYLTNYSDANLTHYSEIVKEDFGIDISAETLRQWLLEIDVVSPKAHRKTKKDVKKKLEEKLKLSNSKKESNEIKVKIEEVDSKIAHPRRERCKYSGEMIQMDASELVWFGIKKCTLHIAIDDATSKVVGAYFDYQETLNGYYHVLYQILTNYGIPAMFYTDRRTVFEYKRKQSVLDDEDTFTQFSFACHKLGIEIKTTSVPQAKGRVERINESFQSRLPIELRRANVDTIEQANEFLKSYLEKYNKQFAQQLNITKSVFEPQPSAELINQYLSIISVRTIDSAHCIRYKNKTYIPSNKNGNSLYLQDGMKVLMVETFDGKLMINAFDNLYYSKEIKLHEDYSQTFDLVDSIELLKYSWSLPRKTPWRYDDFLGYLAKQKHRQDSLAKSMA